MDSRKGYGGKTVYGARVGIWRLMEIFERQGIPVTAALNSEVCEHYPQIVAEGNRLGWEWMAHGHNNSSLFTGMPAEVERDLIGQVLGVIAKATGERRSSAKISSCETRS